MKDSDPDDFLALRVWVLQFVFCLLVIGVLVFFGIAVFIRNGPNPPKAAMNPPALTFIGVGCAVLFVVLHFIIPRLSVVIVRRQIAAGTWNPSTPEDPIPADQLGLGWAAVVFLAFHFIIPRLSVAIARRQTATGTRNPSTPENPMPADQLLRMSDTEKLCDVYASQFTISATLLLMANAMNLAAYMLEGDVVSLVVVVLLLTVWLLRFPTRDRVERFLSEQGKLLQQARQAV